VLIEINFQITRQHAQYIKIIVLSFIIISSWVFLMSGQSILSAAVVAAADSISSSTKTDLDNNNTITESGGQQQKKVAAAGNNIYVTWSDSSFGGIDILFRRSTDSGNNFGSTINLSNDPGDSGTQHMEAAGTNVYIIWQDNTPGNFDILFRKSTNNGNTFGSTINLSNDPGGSSISNIAAAGTNVYIIWDDGTSGNGGTLLRKSTNNGNNFGSTINLSGHPSRAFDPQIAVS
jgi:hypothetical protein